MLNNACVEHTNKQLNKNKKQENILNLFGCIKRKIPEENKLIC